MSALRDLDERGLSLVEVMASMLLFSLITLGVVPLLLMSMRGTDFNRAATIGKTLSQKSMERARGLPYFVSYNSQNRRVDVLDLYHPAYTASGVTTLVCSSGATDPGCPKDIPDDYTVTFTSRFVRGTVDASNNETFATVVPHTTYAWNSTSGADRPSSGLLEMAVQVTWTSGGTARDFTLRSLLGDRKFKDIAVSGSSSVDYGMRVITHFAHTGLGSSGQSALRAVDGRVQASIETKGLSSARIDLRGGDVAVNDVAASGEIGQQIGALGGVAGSAAAPPNQTLTLADGAAQTFTHPYLSVTPTVAGIDVTKAENVQVSVASELPVAKGAYYYVKEQGVRDFWATNELDEVNAAILRLNPLQRMVYSRPYNSGTDFRTHRGEAVAETTALTPASGRHVRTAASVEVRHVGILPTTYIPPSSDGSFTTVLILDEFKASVECKAAPGAGTGQATWSATIRYFRDNVDDDVALGSYQSLTLNQDSDVSAVIASIGNPLVYDGFTSLEDIYLFEEPDKKGYLRSFLGGTSNAGSGDGGRSANASIPGALSIETVATNPSLPDSSFNIWFGSLSCDAVDRR